MKNEIFQDLITAIIDGDIKKGKDSTNRLLEAGVMGFQIVQKGIGEGLRIVGEKFEAKEFFIPDMLTSAHVAKTVMALLKPRMLAQRERCGGVKVVIGTVEGDIHDIGKNIVATMLEGAGFEVEDLGTDVFVSRFVESVRSEKAKILALSALLTTTMLKMSEVIEALVKSGLRDDVKVLVGGAPLDSEFAKKIGADAYGRDGMDAVRRARELIAT